MLRLSCEHRCRLKLLRTLVLFLLSLISIFRVVIQPRRSHGTKYESSPIAKDFDISYDGYLETVDSIIYGAIRSHT